MPKFVWNPDPVAIGFTLNFLYAMIALALFSAIGVYMSRRSGDKGGAMFSAVLAVGALILGFMWADWHPWVQVRYYSLLFVVVFLGGYSLLNWQIRRGGGRAEEAGDFIVYGVVGVLAGARLGHVIFYDLDKALADPFWVVKIWDGGLASHGATVGLIVAMWLFTQQRRVSFLEGADRFSFSAAVGATLVRLGNFMNSEIVGSQIQDGSWGVWFKKTCEARPDGVYGCWQVFGQRAADWADKCPTGGVDCWGTDETEVYRHPSQLYEVGLGILVFVALWVFDRALGKEKRPRGALISLFFLLYFTGRLIVEFFKEYQTPGEIAAESLTTGQWLSMPGIALGLFGLYWTFKNRIPAKWDSKLPRPAVAEDEDDDEEDEEEAPRRVRKATKKSRSRRAAKKAAKQKARPVAADDDDLDRADDDDDDEREGASARPQAAADDEDTDDDDDADDDDAKKPTSPAAAAKAPPAPAKAGGTRRGRRTGTSAAPGKRAAKDDADDDD